jgi:UDP-N-acetylmuramoylalanine--D-glutamate ligase
MLSLKKKKIAVFGMGVSGISALRFVKELDGEIIAINSGEKSTWAKSPGVLDFVSSEHCFTENDPAVISQLQTVDLVILSPGIPRDHVLMLPLTSRNIPIWGEIELAYRYLESVNKLSPMIGITGTNGKTTTTTFFGEMIEGDNKSVFVGGNIGVPFCDYAYEVKSTGKVRDFILLELSSFQLESIDHFKLNVGMILNLYQNHGERYANIEDYGRSKFFLTNRFTADDTLIYAEDFPLIKAWAQTVPGKKIALNTTNPQIKFDISKFKLPGIHNRVNLSFVIAAAEIIGLTKEGIQKSIDTFAGVHHRIEYVDGVAGLSGFKVFNDAKSTNWDATLTAVTAMKDFNLPIHLIIGGKKRGHGDSILPYLDFLKSNVKSFYLIGEMAGEIESEIKGEVEYTNAETLETCLNLLRAKEGKNQGVLLFSPAFPSFDQFKNYVHRGEHFIKIVTND